MTPRIAPVQGPDDEQRAQLAKSPLAPDGTTLNLFRTLAHRPELLRRINALGGSLGLRGQISDRGRELVVLRTAGHVSSPYEAGHHRLVGARAGLSAAEIEAALDPGTAHAWAPEDEALLAATDELIETDTLSDATWEALPGGMGDGARVELLALIGFYRLIGGLANALAIEIDASVAARLGAVDGLPAGR